MTANNIEIRLRQTLLPVFGLDSIDEVPPEASLVKDIGADSLDFVEITYLIERDFGVSLKAGQLVVAGADIDTEEFFVEGRLTDAGALALQGHFSDDVKRFTAGMTKLDLFQTITVRDLARLIAQCGGT